MTRALEINNKGEFKREYVESCPTITKNISYGHQTWQGGDLPSRAPTHKVT